MYGGYQNYNQGASAPPYQGAPQHQQYNPYGSQHPPPNYQGYQQVRSAKPLTQVTKDFLILHPTK